MPKAIPPPQRMTSRHKPERKFDFSPAERKQCHFLVVEREEDTRALMRTSLRNLGFGEVVSVIDHYSGIKKFADRKFTHVIFDARNSEMPAREFLIKCLMNNENIVALPTSYDPTVDNVFELLKTGSAGYLVKPFTEEALEEAVILATKGDRIAEEIINAVNRNQALASITMTALDSLATILRQARLYDTAKMEVTRTKQQFERAVKMGRLFAQDGDAGLVNAFVDRAIQCSEQAASKLGRSRLRRHNS